MQYWNKNLQPSIKVRLISYGPELTNSASAMSYKEWKEHDQ